MTRQWHGFPHTVARSGQQQLCLPIIASLLAPVQAAGTTARLWKPPRDCEWGHLVCAGARDGRSAIVSAAQDGWTVPQSRVKLTNTVLKRDERQCRRTAASKLECMLSCLLFRCTWHICISCQLSSCRRYEVIRGSLLLNTCLTGHVCLETAR